MSRRDWTVGLVVAVGLSGTLAAGLVPTAAELFRAAARAVGPFPAPWDRVGEMLAFPVLALFFHVSLPRPRGEQAPPASRAFLARISLLPIALAAAYGAARGMPSLVTAWQAPESRLAALWYVGLAPLGEELLFRGWIYAIFLRSLGNKVTGDTNPLPGALVLSALAFSVWHLQNLGRDGIALGLFQTLYTFFTGLWLGYLRHRTGNLGAPIAAHVALNLAAALA